MVHFVQKPLAFTKFQKAQSCHEPSFASDLIDQGEDDDVVGWTAGAMYMAGADTVRISAKPSNCATSNSKILRYRQLFL